MEPPRLRRATDRVRGRPAASLVARRRRCSRRSNVAGGVARRGARDATPLGAASTTRGRRCSSRRQKGMAILTPAHVERDRARLAHADAFAVVVQAPDRASGPRRPARPLGVPRRTTPTSSEAMPRATELDQAARVAALVAEHGDAPAVVAGDFNDERERAVIAALPGIEGPAPRRRRTRPTRRRQLIDHVLRPGKATDMSVTVPSGGAEWAAMSDHLPVTTSASPSTLGRRFRSGDVRYRSNPMIGLAASGLLGDLGGVLRTPFASASSR